MTFLNQDGSSSLVELSLMKKRKKKKGFILRVYTITWIPTEYELYIIKHLKLCHVVSYNDTP